jgi:hypothetical protein
MVHARIPLESRGAEPLGRAGGEPTAHVHAGGHHGAIETQIEQLTVIRPPLRLDAVKRMMPADSLQFGELVPVRGFTKGCTVKFTGIAA